MPLVFDSITTDKNFRITFIFSGTETGIEGISVLNVEDLRVERVESVVVGSKIIVFSYCGYMPTADNITIREIISFDTATYYNTIALDKDCYYPHFYCGYTDKFFIRFVFCAEHPTPEQVLIDEVHFRNPWFDPHSRNFREFIKVIAGLITVWLSLYAAEDVGSDFFYDE